MTRRLIFLQAAALVIFPVARMWAQAGGDVEAVVETELGRFRLEFAGDKAPKHVAQFLRLAREGFYNGSAFHRAVMNGIIQGGDPLLKDAKTPRNLWGTGGLNMLAPEFSDMKHARGVVSSVSIPNKANSEGAQFFVCVVPQPSLDGKYTTFATVNEGMDVVERISQVGLDSNGLLEKPVRILRVSIEPKKREPFADASIAELKRTVTMKTTLGTVKIAMRPEWAPENVRNFLKLVQSGWLKGTAFHRVAKGFVAQGGMPQTREGRPIHDGDRWVRLVKRELSAEAKHKRGALSMAHGEDPNSATTSFFLVLADAAHLDGEYSVFAEIADSDAESKAVLDAFDKEEVDGETPKRRIEILSAIID